MESLVRTKIIIRTISDAIWISTTVIASMERVDIVNIYLASDAFFIIIHFPGVNDCSLRLDRHKFVKNITEVINNNTVQCTFFTKIKVHGVYKY